MNLVAKVEFMKMSTLQEEVQYVSVIRRQSVTSKHRKTLDKSMEESHLHDLPFEYGIKSLSRLVVCYRERRLANLKYQKKLNLCVWHIPEALKSLFARLLCSYRSHTPLVTKFCIETYGFMNIKCSYCKPLSQNISRNEKNLQ